MQTAVERTGDKVYFRGRTTTKNGVSPHRLRWTVDEYYKIYEQGLFEGRRVELIKGEIFEMSPMLSPHATGIRLAQEALRNVFTEGFDIRAQMPMSFSRIDEPEPDVAVVAGSIMDYKDAHPTTAVLLVEVALTSVRFDRTKKLKLYAENKIEDYWIVNLKQRHLEVYRKPFSTGSDFDYAEKNVLSLSDSVSPLAMPNAKIPVSDLIP